MNRVNLSVSAYGVNAAVHSRRFCDAIGMAEKEKDGWRSELQRTFARRLKEEMDARQLSGNAISRAANKRGYRLRQSSVSRVLSGEQDPTLTTALAISEAIGLPTWYFLTDPEGEERVIRTPTPPPNVVHMGSPSYRVLKSAKVGEKTKPASKKRG